MTELPRLKDSNGQYTIRLHPISCPFYQSLSPLSTANLELPSTDDISTFDWVQMFTPDGKSEYYRVASVSTNTVTGDKSVYLEHGACTLGDILIPDTAVDVTPSSGRSTSHGANTKEYTENKTDTISNLLTYILNKQPSPAKWAKGTVEATDTIYIELGGFTLLSSISSMMQYIPDYQLEFVQNSASQWLINIKQRPTTVLCEGRLSRNLVSCDVSYSTSNIITRVYSDGITGGHVDSTNIATYGLHEETQTLSDNLSEAQKLSIIQAYLRNHDHPSLSITISGIELSQITGLDIDKFTVGSVCRITVPWLNLTEEEVIIDKRYTDVYNEPESVTMTLANATPDLVIAMAAITSTVSGGGGGMGGGLKGEQEQKEKEKKRYETRMEKTDEYFRFLATDTQWDDMGNGTLTAYGQLVVTSESVQSVVSDIANSGYSSITQLASEVNLKVAQGDVSTWLSVECDNVTIGSTQAGGALLNVAGYVTATEFDGEIARIDNFFNGTTMAQEIYTVGLQIPQNGWLNLFGVRMTAKSMNVCDSLTTDQDGHVTYIHFGNYYYIGY